MRPPPRLAAAFAAALPGLAAAFRSNGLESLNLHLETAIHRTVPAAAPSNATAAQGAEGDKVFEAQREKCSKITECYCVKATPCGWCATFGEAMVGHKDGPLEPGIQCPKWITNANSCPTLYCSTESRDETMSWWIHCSWFPCLCLVMWIVTYIWREVLRAKHLPKTVVAEKASQSVNFTTGQAVGDESFASDVSGEDGLTFIERQAIDLFGTKRSFEAFRKGLDCPEQDRLPTDAARPYELNLSDLSTVAGENYEKSRVGTHRFAVTLRIAMQWRTALGATMVSAIGLMFLSSLYLMALRTCARHLRKDEYEWLALVTKEMGAVVASLQTAVTLLLAWYALNRIQWFWSILMEGVTLGGRAHDVAMIAGACPVKSEADWKARFQLYRHLMLCFFYAYQAYTPKLRFAGFGPLIRCGLLLPAEAEQLKLAHRHPGTVCEAWVSRWIDKHMKLEARQQAYMGLREYRGSIASISDLIEQRAPVSFESLLYIVVYALCAALPFGPANIDYANREAVMRGPHVATAMGTAMLCAFYLALLHMLRHLQAPFDDIGAPHDALNPIALMNSTERKLRDYLSAPPPKSPAAVASQEAANLDSPTRAGSKAMG